LNFNLVISQGCASAARIEVAGTLRIAGWCAAAVVSLVLHSIPAAPKH